MPAPLLPIVIAAAAVFLLASKKKKPATSACAPGQEMVDGGCRTPPPPPPPASCPTCFDPGLPAALAAELQALLASATTMGPAALLTKAGDLAKMGFPCAAACLKGAADVVSAGGRGTLGGLVLPGGGHAGSLTLPNGQVIEIPDVLAQTGPTFPQMPMQPVPMPTTPGSVPLFTFQELSQGRCLTSCPFDAPGLHAPILLRPHDDPARLASYYGGNQADFFKANVHLASVAAFAQAAAGHEGVLLPHTWHPYSRPLPVPGTVTPTSPAEWPLLPPTPIPFL